MRNWMTRKVPEDRPSRRSRSVPTVTSDQRTLHNLSMLRRWLRKETTYPSGDTFTRLEGMLCTVGLLAMLPVPLVVFFFVIEWTMAGLARQSTGYLAVHAAKLGILSLL